jgi:hypothetical protein
MDKGNYKQVRELTLEAEAGHGQGLRAELDRLPFEEQIQLARQIAHLSKDDSLAFGFPEIEFVTDTSWSDASSKNGYSNLKLYRKISGDWGPLTDKEELLYQSSLNLTTGNKTASDNNL